MVVFWILGALFLALIIIVPLIEKFGPRMSKEEIGKIARYILPLAGLLLILQLLAYIF